jgi:heptosyltransferase I
MNILIIKLSAIGDVVQTLPALEAIKKTFPKSFITWLVEEDAAGILVHHPLIDRLMISRRKVWLGLLRNPFTVIRGLGCIIRFVRELRSTHYDIAIDFQGLFKSGVLIGLSRAGRKIGFDRTREFSYLFLNERLPAFDPEKHALQRYLDIARYLGAKDPDPTCALPLVQEQVTIKNRIDLLNSPHRPLVVINPVARWKTKLWLESNFAELADRLVKERQVSVVFTGSKGDGILVERILSLMREQAWNWTGQTTLKELAALASYADLFITTDTGPMHLAAAAGARVLALFGPTAPWRTGPYGSRHIVIRTGIHCSPCFRRKCDHVRCMEGITVDDVMKKIDL